MGIREDWQTWVFLEGEVSIGLPTLDVPFLRDCQPLYSRTGVTGA